MIHEETTMKDFGESIYDRIGEFRPHRTDDLHPEMEKLIGVKVGWLKAWTMGNDDPFPGEAAYVTDDERFKGRWAPERDIVFDDSKISERRISI